MQDFDIIKEKFGNTWQDFGNLDDDRHVLIALC